MDPSPGPEKECTVRVTMFDEGGTVFKMQVSDGQRERSARWRRRW
jgi:hypothetical protein